MNRVDRRILTVLRANQGAARFTDILRDGGFTFASTGRIYASLDRMGEAGWIDRYVSLVDNRTVYHLTGRAP